MNKIIIQSLQTPAGELILGSFNDHLCLADWRVRDKRKAIDRRLQQALNSDYFEGNSQVLDAAKLQLSNYFESSRQSFDIPLLLLGSTFQKNVWQELRSIPYGQTASYTNIAHKIGNKQAVRAVANANAANALAIFIPCHRVVGRNGALTGYAGGLDTKKALLELEQKTLVKQGLA